MSEAFQTIQSIDSEKSDSWQGYYFLTLDIDWAHDEVLSDTINLIEDADVRATWFVTHDTPILDRLRENPKFELGIHPNFNFLLNGQDDQGRTAEDVIDRILKIVPEARSVRSHSMTQNSNLLDLFKQKGLRFDCNHFIPDMANIELKPWLHWNGLTKLPYFWEDDVACLYGRLDHYIDLKEAEGLRVFDFHPIHVFLNTEHMGRYERTRALHCDPALLLEQRNHDTLGARDILLEIMRWK